MIDKITGEHYASMIRYGINHLDRNRTVINDLNVFPVPDGDTGTNMVMTMKNGLQAIPSETDNLAQVALSFANATVFGARGNSGVIVSQFFKGVSDGLKDHAWADCAIFAKSLDSGCKFAYSAVANPVEGTILTVIKDATTVINDRLEHLQSIDALVDMFLEEAQRSLENTPNLLPILAKAGVVDSGGAGLVCFFEGIQRYLNGEEPEESEDLSPAVPQIDYSAFDRHSNFDYGYCTEVLLQLTMDHTAFNYEKFLHRLQKLGNSVVTSLEVDKIKLHIHTKRPESVLEFCHKYGEFLSLKIENMSVQHTQTTQKFLCAKNANTERFAVVAVAPNSMLQSMLSEMGADVVIMSEESPSSQDFIEAFDHVSAPIILVFPNSSNSILSAMQATSLYKKAQGIVLNCRSIAQCYSALAIIDYDDPNIKSIVGTVNDTIHNMYEVDIAHATKNVTYGNKKIVKNDYFSIAGDDILFTGDQLEDVVLRTVQEVVYKRDCAVLTMFYGKNVTKERLGQMLDTLEGLDYDVEIDAIATQDPIYDMVLSFE